MNINRPFIRLLALLALSTLNPQLSTIAQGTAFTYQGRLNAGANPAQGIYDLRFTIYDAFTNGSVVAGPVTNAATGVTNGLFTVTLDFGPGVFNGSARWLDIGVRTNGATSFATLAPRQQLTPTPYAVYSANAGSATTATTAASVPASGIGAGTASINISGYAVTAVSAASAGSAAVAAMAVNFTGPLSGDVTGTQSATVVASVGGQTAANVAGGAGAANAATSANTAGTIVRREAGGNFSAGSITLDGSLILPETATAANIIYSGSSTLLCAINGLNFFAGFSAGNLTMSGIYNTGNGANALHSNTSGVANTADGVNALYSNTSGSGNLASGWGALYSNTNGLNNTADGMHALYHNTSGNNNIALGFEAGYNITTGSSNIDIGNPGLATDTNIIRIGSGQTSTFIAGVITGNGLGLTNLDTSHFGSGILTNGQTGVTLNGTFSGNGTSVTNVNAATLNGLNATNFWQLGGNNVSSGQFLGSTNNQAVEIWVNNLRALRLEPTSNDVNHTNLVNIVGGSPVNTIVSGFRGSVIAGGGGYYYGLDGNSISSDMSFIGGGSGNSIQMFADSSFLGGGSINSIGESADFCFLGCGDGNSIQMNNAASFLGGGDHNTIEPGASLSFLGGGQINSIQTNASYSFLGGGYGNYIQNRATNSVLVGGFGNTIQQGGWRSFLGGGANNSIQANAYYSFLGGGQGNSLSASNSFLGGGKANSIQTYAACSFLGGGYYNVVSGVGAVVVGGGYDGSSINGNTASGIASIVVGGMQNIASGNRSTVGGGHNNSATNIYATVPGGAWNLAGGTGSFAAGQAAKAVHDGAFVWSDSSSPDVVSTNANSVTMRASGGYRLFSGASSGVYLASGGGSWTSMSDRNAKENFTPVNAVEVLAKVAALPMTVWNYKSQDASIRHLGPMAQDFKAAFAVGETDTGITGVDADGVALAAIQGLNQKLEQKETEITELKARLERLEQLVIAKNGGRQ